MSAVNYYPQPTRNTPVYYDLGSMERPTAPSMTFDLRSMEREPTQNTRRDYYNDPGSAIVTGSFGGAQRNDRKRYRRKRKLIYDDDERIY
jgi:hypothetical protein